jgi:hypothetical protein
MPLAVVLAADGDTSKAFAFHRRPTTATGVAIASGDSQTLSTAERGVLCSVGL